jgi:hypothetical protein
MATPLALPKITYRVEVLVTDHTSNEELPVGTYFALLVTSLLVTRPFHNLPTGKQAHNLLQHARAGNICTSRWVFFPFLLWSHTLLVTPVPITFKRPFDLGLWDTGHIRAKWD